MSGYTEPVLAEATRHIRRRCREDPPAAYRHLLAECVLHPVRVTQVVMSLCAWLDSIDAATPTATRRERKPL